MDVNQDLRKREDSSACCRDKFSLEKKKKIVGNQRKQSCKKYESFRKMNETLVRTETRAVGNKCCEKTKETNSCRKIIKAVEKQNKSCIKKNAEE